MAKDEKKKGFFGRLYNVSEWTNKDEVFKTGKDILKQAKGLGEVGKATREETFEQAIARMNLTEADVQNRMKQSYRLAWIFFALAIAVLLYGIIVLIQGFWAGIIICIVLSAFGFTLAFRESFWYFQMKKRKLGCTFDEWFNFILRRSK